MSKGQSLFERLKRWENNAIEELFRETHHTCYRFILKNGTLEDAQDTTQEMMVNLLEKINSPGFFVRNIKGYFVEMVKKSWLERIRKAKNKPRKIFIDQNSEVNHLIDKLFYRNYAEVNSIDPERALKVIRDELKRLSNNCQHVVISYYVYGIPLAEIAKELKMTYNFIRVKRKRCFETLQNAVFNQLNKDHDG